MKEFQEFQKYVKFGEVLLFTHFTEFSISSSPVFRVIIIYIKSTTEFQSYFGQFSSVPKLTIILLKIDYS